MTSEPIYNTNLVNNIADTVCPTCKTNIKFFYSGSVYYCTECANCHTKFKLIPEQFQEQDDALIEALSNVDRWQPRDNQDTLIHKHIKVVDFDTKNRTVTFSWWEGEQGLEDELSFDEFKNRFVKKY